MKQYMDFIDYGPVYIPIVKKITVKQFGIPKIVIVGTRKNGGVK